MLNVIYLEEALLQTPQISEATSVLNDWWLSKLCGLGALHRATTENLTDSIEWEYGFPIHSTIGNIDEIFELLGISNYTQAKQVLLEFDNATFDYSLPAIFMDGMEGKAAKFWAISSSHALNPDKDTFSITLGWYDVRETGVSEWTEETFDAAGRNWFNSKLPGNVDDYIGFDGVEEIKYVYYKGTGNLRSAKFYGDTRNILYNCETTPWTHLTEGALEVCTSSNSNELYIDPTNLVPEIIAANTGTMLASSGRNNSDNTYLRIMPAAWAETLGDETDDIPTEMYLTSFTDMEFANVEIYMDISGGGYVVEQLRNHYANGHVSEWYSANSALDARIV